MAKQTKEQRIVEFLTEMGCRELPSASRKYRKFSHPKFERFYFVGHSGAVRVGEKASNTISVSEMFMQKVRRWEARKEATKSIS